MKDSINEKLKDTLNSKIDIPYPRTMAKDFNTAFKAHREKKIRKQRFFFSLSGALVTLIVFIAFNSLTTVKTQGDVKDYLAFMEKNFTSEDHVLDSIDELNTISYTYIDFEENEY